VHFRVSIEFPDYRQHFTRRGGRRKAMPERLHADFATGFLFGSDIHSRDGIIADEQRGQPWRATVSRLKVSDRTLHLSTHSLSERFAVKNFTHSR
jgi:hypothetical protein